MKYKNIKEGIFISRPNRFIAYCEVDGKKEICHVKNTGRCKELLIPGAKVLLEKSDNEKRKTPFDLVSVYKGERLINMDSMAPNKVFGEYVSEGKFIEAVQKIKPEYTYGNSRIDFYIEAGEKKILAEVKGVTLEIDNAVYFPDAPTERGVKHIDELIKAKEEGFEVYVIFVTQMKGVRFFSPNRNTHPEFAHKLIEAKNKGVNIKCYECEVSIGEVNIIGEVPIIL
ncbi:MAG: DNA/RNA nuclease SfsA [Ruminococcaceae bacterium]|nr:DNA/RNA nuclease SfsA [Oscillospiraceae bacterium]